MPSSLHCIMGLRQTILLLLLMAAMPHFARAQKQDGNYIFVLDMQPIPHANGPYRISSVSNKNPDGDTLGYARVGNLNKRVPVVSARPIEESIDAYIHSFFNHCNGCTPFRMVILNMALSELDEAASQHSVAALETEFYSVDTTGNEVHFHTSKVNSQTAHRDATPWLEDELRKAIALALDELGKKVNEMSSADSSRISGNQSGNRYQPCAFDFDKKTSTFSFCERRIRVTPLIDLIDQNAHPDVYLELTRYRTIRTISSLLGVTGGAALGVSAGMLATDKELIPGVLAGGVIALSMGIFMHYMSKDNALEAVRLYNLSLGIEPVHSALGRGALIAGYTFRF